MTDSMQQAYDRDQDATRRLRSARQAIDAFLADPPSRCKASTLELLQRASENLKDEQDHITAVWN